MPFDGAGNFNRLYDWTDDAAAAVAITASRFDDEMDGMVTGMELAWLRDGQNSPSVSMPMNSNKFTGMAAGSAATDSAHLGQVQAQAYLYGTTGGSANAQTLSPSPAITAYAAGQLFRVKVGGGLTNTTDAVTFQVSGLASPKSIKDIYGSDPGVGALRAGCIAELIYDGTNFVLLRSHMSEEFISAVTASASATVDFTIPSWVRRLRVEMDAIVPATDARSFLARVSIASAYKSDANYQYDTHSVGNATDAASSNTSGTSMALSNLVDTGTAAMMIHGTFEIWNCQDTTRYKPLISHVRHLFDTGGYMQSWRIDGQYQGGTGALDGIRFLMDSGNITSGVFRFYGTP